jgi:hypothetical protein
MATKTEAELVKFMDSNLYEIEQRCKQIREEIALAKDLGLSVCWGIVLSKLVTISEQETEAWFEISQYTRPGEVTR